MDYSVFLSAVCIFIESHVRSGFERGELEHAIGYSYSHVRKAFGDEMQIPLARYVLLRRLSYAAFDIVHTEKRLLDIAVSYGFDSYDAFTRAFKRETGLLPSEFRRLRAKAGRRYVAAGVYAPAILDIPDTHENERKYIMNGINSGILMGVPKVEYCWEQATPFPACLKAVLNYLGQDVSYAYIMAASGAAFRLRWSRKFWDGGNVDITYIYNDSTEAFRRSFEAAGRTYRILSRDDSDKQGFINFIKNEIDAGRPVIALGIIGPPEACIITGYQNGGDTLLGWNFFQHRPEYNKGTKFHECGYFISDTWWENPETLMLMSVGEAQNELISDKEILENAIRLTDRDAITWGVENDNEVACGQEAYKTWAEWTADDKQFAPGITLSLLSERFMCQSDAQTMIGEGRWYAGDYMKSVAQRHEEVSGFCLKAAEIFQSISNIGAKEMTAVYSSNGYGNDEDTLRSYAKPKTRAALAELIRKAARYEKQAMELLGEIMDKICI